MITKPMICLKDLSNYRDRDVNMPDSPDAKVQTPISPVTGSTAPRPLSASGNIAVMNGAHSPVGSMNGRTPSPAGAASLSSQQLPPACGARQLSKLKRFLTTLQQFGSDISPEIGERVRNLVLGLVNSHLSIEEFHAKLQEATNFPLRPFVIPFLKANLPLLQRELLHCARVAKQTPQQYLSHNEHILFDASSQSPVESQDQVLSEINDNRKRKSPQDRAKENVTETSEPPEKRVHSSLSPGHTVSPTTPLSITTGGPIRLQDINLSRELRERERLERERYERERMERERERQLASSFSFHRPDGLDNLERIDDDWKHVETMLHCIIGMVDKTKRALAVLQERSQRDREELAVWMRRQSDGFDSDMKKRTNEMMAHTLRQTEDRVSEVKRRAEEAVNEVKRQAVSELQKAVGTAESKANEIISNERNKIERSIADARKQAHDEVMSFLNTQEESSESCWNCGRKASETCSGCNVARYCGSFCQHKDWETHHRVCGQQNVSREAQSTSAPAEIPATTSNNSTQQGSAPSPTANKSATSSKSGSRSGSPVETKSTEVTR